MLNVHKSVPSNDVSFADAKNNAGNGIKPRIAENPRALARLKKLGIEFRDEVKGKPVFEIESNRVINKKSHFGAKKLCNHLTFTTGHACIFKCSFCYVEALLHKNKKIRAILNESGLSFQDIAVEIADPASVARKALTKRHGTPKFNDANDTRVIYASPLVDVAATMAHVDTTVEVCKAILELTNWHIRLLSKSSLLGKLARKIPEEFTGRMIYGFSTGTLDDDLAKIFEEGTPLVSKRLAALHELQDSGYRTFGMPCPTLPQKDYEKFAADMATAIRVDRCEHVWAEVLNPRGKSLPATAAALRKAGRNWEANEIERLSKDKAAREDYARQTFLAFTKVVPPEKLRFMQYVTKATRAWWAEREAMGAILLGRHAKDE